MATKPRHFLEGKKVIVAGSGIAGLAFVVAFRKLWDASLQAPEIIIYDRDVKEVSVRREGYSLSLNGMDQDSGLIALRDLGLLDEILAHAILGTDSQWSFKMWNSDWRELIALRFKAHGGLPTPGIRIARRDLRNILTEAGETAATVSWGTTCTAAERLDNGRLRVHLAGPDGSTNARIEDCDLLIAADGAHSRIRASFRPDDNLVYTGIIQTGGVARFDNGIPQPLDRDWGIVVTGKGIACFCSPVDKTGVVWALSWREGTERPSFDNTDPKQVRAMLEEAREKGHMLAEPFQMLVGATEPAKSIILHARDKTPFPHTETPQGVFFIGDSNHAVSPFAGNGANLALKDGWDLAAKLCQSDSLESAVTAYDKVAVPRAVKTLKTSHQRIKMGHSTGLQFHVFRVFVWIGSWIMWLTGR